jgi:glycosyltransferase involved in cell wall biosynthesis
MVRSAGMAPDLARQVERLGGCDILIGIPSYNNATTVGYVVKTAIEGARLHFPGLKAAVVNADGGSSDGTELSVLAAAEAVDSPVASGRYRGIPGKGSAFRAIFEAVGALRPRAAVVLDADLRSIDRHWIGQLCGPILSDQADYVAPYYFRHKHDATITNAVAYPLTRALYGFDLRQPIGGDFAFAPWLADYWAAEKVWEGPVARFGVDIWMTTTALIRGGRVVQTNLGLKVHDPRDPSANLSNMFREVVGTAYELMGQEVARWWYVERSVPVPLLDNRPYTEPEEVEVSLEAMDISFLSGYSHWRDLWRRWLDEDVFDLLSRAAGSRRYRLEASLWASIVYDFAVAYNRVPDDREGLLLSMVPLYLARTATFVRDAQGLSSLEAEDLVRDQALTFEALKPYLRLRWRRAGLLKNQSAAPVADAGI